MLQFRITAAVGGALSVEYRFEFADGDIHVIVNDDEVEFVPVRHVAPGLLQTAGDDLIVVSAAIPQAPLQFRPRRGQNENADTVGHRLAYLPGALPVNFKYDVITHCQVFLHLRTASAVIVAENQRRFE